MSGRILGAGALAACLWMLSACSDPGSAEAAAGDAGTGSAAAGSPAEGDFRARLTELGERFGVEVRWQGGPYRFKGDLGGGEARDAAAWEIEMFTPILVEELALYPDSFLRDAGIEGVTLVRDLWIDEEGVTQNVGGYIFDNRIVMSVSYTYKVNNRDKQRRYLHHLIWHQLDGLWGTMWEDPEWAALNPPGFEYGMYTGGGIHDRSSESGLLTTEYPGFINRYGTGYLADDKADLFAYLMVVHHWVESRAQADDVIRAKVQTVKKRLAEFDPAFDGAFWERLDGIGRNVETYMTP